MKYILNKQSRRFFFISTLATLNVMTNKNSFKQAQNTQTPLLGINIKDYGAIGDGIADEATAIRKAIDAAIKSGTRTVIIPSGFFLVKYPINILTNELSLVGTGIDSILVKHKNASAIFLAEEKDRLKFQNLTFKVASDTPGFVQKKEMIRLTECHHFEVSNCTFDAFNGKKELTLFSLLNTPSCDYGTVKDCHFKGSYGNCCGPHNGEGDDEHGQHNTFVDNIIEDFADTGIGLWTNTRFNTIENNIIRGLKLKDNVTKYPGVGIDVAGALDTVIRNNIIEGSNIGIRILTNLDYPNERIRIEGNKISAQEAMGPEHPAIGIKMHHYSKNMSITLINNQIEINSWGVAVFSTTPQGKLEVQIDKNRFSGKKGIGILYQGLNNQGKINFIPGTNNFELDFATAQAVQPPNAPIGAPNVTFNPSLNLIANLSNLRASQGKQVFHQTNLEAGIYGVYIKFGRMLDLGGIGANASVYGLGFVLSAALENKDMSFTVRVPTPGVQSFHTICHPAGHDHNIENFKLVRLA